MTALKRGDRVRVTVERCPTCGSPDPAKDQLMPYGTEHFGAYFAPHNSLLGCPDSFHALDQDGAER